MTTDDAGKPALIAELGELDVALDELRKLFEDEDRQAQLELQRLEADDADLARLGSMLSGWRDEVDVFDALRLHGDEQFHSNLLAWLLDPGGSHGFGDRFLRGFLAQVGARGVIRAADLPSTTVRREHYLEQEGESGRLDILIRNESAEFLCAIENKVWASESGDQLAWYRKVLACHYPNHRVCRVFLTPRGVVPDNPGERERWKGMSYTDVLRLVEGAIAAEGNSANEDVMAFLRQYAITLRRNIVPEVSNDVHELARRIYRKHKRAIDLIIEHRERYEPNYVTEGFRMIRDAIGRQPLWKESTSNHPYVRFVSSEWEKYEEELRLESWPYNLLQFQVQVTDRWATLTFFMAPSENETLRRKMFDRVRDCLDTLHAAQPTYTEDYVRLHTAGNILEESDYESWWDEESILGKIRCRLDDFARGQFPEINRIIVACLEEYRTEGR